MSFLQFLNEGWDLIPTESEDSYIDKYEIMHNNVVVGNVWVSAVSGKSPSHASKLELSIYPINRKEPLKLGYAGARELIQDIARLYPYAESVRGMRQTGVHSKKKFPYTYVSLDMAHRRNIKGSYDEEKTKEAIKKAFGIE